jgi:ribonuclease R
MRKKKSAKKEPQTNEKIATGILRMHPRGFGFVQPDNVRLFSQDIFIPKHLTKNAVDGDSVEVLINNEPFSEKGPDGKILSILKRSRTHMAGIIAALSPSGEAFAFVPLLGTSKKVVVTPLDERPLKVGDRLIMKVVNWGQDNESARAEMSHYLGHISDPSVDVSAAIEEHDLRSDFPQQALDQARSFGTKVPLKEIKKRKDLRDEITFTIDPDTAKDFDDALSLTRTKEGGYSLKVHIADVSYYVEQDSPLDVEARLRCNSTYFPGFCLPMLPHELSSELCSLKPKVNRLTLTVEILFDHEGKELSHKIYRSVIKSCKRFTYKEALAVLEGRKKSIYLPELNLMVELCHLLKKRRAERGSIEFALSEQIIKVNENGQPIGTEKIEYDITHQLVEEFMLKANEVVATHLSEKGEPLTYRVHDAPNEESLKEFALLAHAFGFSLPKKPTAQDYQKLFLQAKDSPYASYLATAYIRSMKLAYYSPINEGHFGLSLEYYCHFTSPIRRYVDLVVHRIVSGRSHELETLSAICHASSEQERYSAKAEQATVLLKKLRYLNLLNEKNPTSSYKATITRIKSQGIIFELDDLALDSFLHISELHNDYFVYNEERSLLVGRHTGIVYGLGTQIEVTLESIDLITSSCKWHLARDAKDSTPEEGEEPVTTKKKKRKKRRRSKKSE